MTCVIGHILHYENGQLREQPDELAEEEPLEIRVRGRAISVTMRTSGHDAELAAGFLLSEGIIHRRPDVLEIKPCDANEHGNVINVLLAPDVAVNFASLTRHVFASSSCGLCGKATLDSVRGSFSPVSPGEPVIESALLAKLPEVMRHEQEAFGRTGGLHAAALFESTGKLIVLREDIGRHNAVDKVLGFAFLNSLLPLESHILMLSGRSSFEIMQKALAGGIPIVAAISAPSSLAVSFAAECRQTLVGFLRGDRMNVYAGFNRVRF